MQTARSIAKESDRDFIWSAYSSAYQEVVERQFGVWGIRLQKSAFGEKWRQDGFEIMASNGIYSGGLWITSEEGFIQLRDIFLAPEYQGQGIGTQVVREELKKARAANMPLRLRVLKQSYAIALYERLGFTRCGETPTQYWMEAS
ncbi:GNAT family N-acetyltransferase [Halomonas sp. PAMB 3264]|uniref:GNAT family N-acetyltransferase n=1 Tax=Halomonas sp. PAMB 3264 TaxID=3075222 RepID=UPI0028A2427A|nr:GNAT family N-acetyltransferase [Halomonas sp. PAMB 3264]WNL41050.1 GNAT family N-acetyltransferase [Halomonas sp. PAMB 3264]